MKSLNTSTLHPRLREHPMPEIIDDSKYAKGTGLFSVYENVSFPEDVKKRCMALLDFGTETLLKNDFIILDFVPYPGLGRVGPEDVLKYSWILSESHRVLMYDPKTKTLIDELYTCSPEKDGRLMFEAANQRIGKPVKSTHLSEIVSKEMAHQEEPDKLFHSVQDASKKFRMAPKKNYCVSTVFFDISDRKLDEDSLETMLTKALNKDDQKPVIESACRYDPQGLYLHPPVAQAFRGFAQLSRHPEIRSLEPDWNGRGGDSGTGRHGRRGLQAEKVRTHHEHQDRR